MNSTKKDYFLFLGPDAPEKVYWAERPAYGEVVTGQGSLSEALHLYGEKVVVLVPGSDVLLAEVVIPGNRGRIIEKSIPYALEENLAEDIGNLHFAHGSSGKTGEVPVVVVAKTKMESWLTILNDNGVEAKCIVPATMAIPFTPGQWSVVVSDRLFMLRKDSWHAYAGDINSLPFYLEAELTSDSNQQPSIQLYVDDGCSVDYEEIVPDLSPVTTDKKPLLQFLVDGYEEKEVINLLQGAYSRHAGWRDLWKKWRLPAIAVMALFLLNITGFSFDYFKLKNENIELNNRIKAIYLKSFPGSRRVVNARAQMEQKLVELKQEVGTQSGFFEIYDKTVPLLLATSGFSLNNFRFNNGRFDFDFDIKDLQALEKLKHNLLNIPGVAIDIKHAEASGSLVKAKIQIKSRQ